MKSKDVPEKKQPEAIKSEDAPKEQQDDQHNDEGSI